MAAQSGCLALAPDPGGYLRPIGRPAIVGKRFELYSPRSTGSTCTNRAGTNRLAGPTLKGVEQCANRLQSGGGARRPGLRRLLELDFADVDYARIRDRQAIFC